MPENNELKKINIKYGYIITEITKNEAVYMLQISYLTRLRNLFFSLL